MKAKMTDYKGIYFRSRLEARWCEFSSILALGLNTSPKDNRLLLVVIYLIFIFAH